MGQMFDPYSVWTVHGVATGRLNIQEYQIKKIKDQLGRLMVTCQMDFIFSTVNELDNMEDKAVKLHLLDRAVEVYCKIASGFDNLDLVEAVHQMKQEINSGSGPWHLFR